MLLERLSLASITRVVGVSKRWLQYYVNNKYKNFLNRLRLKKGKDCLTIERDERWSFVKAKQNKQWIWLALDRQTREIVGVAIEDRCSQMACQLWDSLPGV